MMLHLPFNFKEGHMVARVIHNKTIMIQSHIQNNGDNDDDDDDTFVYEIA